MNIQEQKADKSVIIGDWSKDTVRLDFDDTSLNKVKYWAFIALKWFHLDGFVILRSSIKTHNVYFKGKIVQKYSEGSYLIIFNRKVKWDLNFRIMSWVAIQSHIQSLKDYVLMQGIKGSSTTRCGCKGEKPSPKIVFKYGEQNGQIAKFLEIRNFIKNFERKGRE